jgi:hypothetical protein
LAAPDLSNLFEESHPAVPWYLPFDIQQCFRNLSQAVQEGKNNLGEGQDIPDADPSEDHFIASEAPPFFGSSQRLVVLVVSSTTEEEAMLRLSVMT